MVGLYVVTREREGGHLSDQLWSTEERSTDAPKNQNQGQTTGEHSPNMRRSRRHARKGVSTDRNGAPSNEQGELAYRS